MGLNEINPYNVFINKPGILFWAMVKQCRPRSDTASAAFDQGLHGLLMYRKVFGRNGLMPVLYPSDGGLCPGHLKHDIMQHPTLPSS